MKFMLEPWPWYVVGPLITLIMLLMFIFGKSFGVSSNFRTICAIGGAGKYSDFFNFNWRDSVWNLVFIFGAALGGYLANNFFMGYDTIEVSQATVQELQTFGIDNKGEGIAPSAIFSWENLFTLRSFIMIVVGGFFVGFGTRYGGGCTSGHAITGLSNLQLPSLLAVIGFFIGGLVMTWLILPFLLTL